MESNEIFESFMRNQIERMGIGTILDETLEKSEEELIELLRVIQDLKKIEKVYKLKIIDNDERMIRRKKCFQKLCEEMSHVLIATQFLGSSIDSSFDEMVSEEKLKKLSFMKDIAEKYIQ